MKTRNFLAGAFIFAIGAGRVAADGNSFSANTDRVQIATALGWQIAHEKEVNGIEISKGELTNFLAGFVLGVQDHPFPLDMRRISPDVTALAEVRQQKVFDAILRGI